MDELNNYVVIGLDNYNDMRDELAVSRSIIVDYERTMAEKDEIISQLSNQILFLHDQIAEETVCEDESVA